MKARQARKIIRYGFGGPTHRVNVYWYRRIYAYIYGHGYHDHRITRAVRIVTRTIATDRSPLGVFSLENYLNRKTLL